MKPRRPVVDWTTDFDHTDPRWIEDPYPIWDELRSSCPIAHSERFEGGAYFPSRFEDVRTIAYDTEHFTSRRVIVRVERTDPVPTPPITSDPPEHRAARRPLLPPFNPRAVDKLIPYTRALCAQLVEELRTAGRADAASEYAQHVPTHVIARLLGVDEQDGDRFRRWIKMILEEGIHDPRRSQQGTLEMSAFFEAELDKRGSAPADDLIAYLRDLRADDGSPVPRAQIIGTMRLLLLAGVDTTWSAIGASLWHLASHPEDRRRLAAEPSLMDTAVEELLRAYAPVTTAREVSKDVEIGGRTLRAGSMSSSPSRRPTAIRPCSPTPTE